MEAPLKSVSGLTPNDAIVVNPSDSLLDGSAVRISTNREGAVRK
jgi:hypothetical protein